MTIETNNVVGKLTEREQAIVATGENLAGQFGWLYTVSKRKLSDFRARTKNTPDSQKDG